MLRDTVVVLDFETTGLEVETSRMIEVAALRLEAGRVTARLDTLVRSAAVVPVDVTRLTGIDDGMLRSAPSAQFVVARLLEFIRDLPVFAHNADFDQRILQNELVRQRRRSHVAQFLCTRRIASRVLPGLTSYSLAALTARCHLTFAGTEHRAMGDCMTTANLLSDLVRRIEARRGVEADVGLLADLSTAPASGASHGEWLVGLS